MINSLTNHFAGDCRLCIQLQAKCKNIKNANQTGTENMLTMKFRLPHVQRAGLPLHFAFTYIVVGVAHAQAGIIYLEFLNLFDSVVYETIASVLISLTGNFPLKSYQYIARTRR